MIDIERIEKEMRTLLKLEEDLQPVRDLIKEKQFAEAAKIGNDILEKVHGTFVVRYRKLIEPMFRLDPDEYKEWIRQPHYKYHFHITTEHNDPLRLLPQIVADKPYDAYKFEPLKGDKKNG